jgi:hypothetical protein
MTWDGAPAGGTQTGKGVTVPAIGVSANANVAVTFAQPYASPPVVTVIPFNGRLTPGMVAVSTTGFTVNLANWSGGAAGATTLDWVAHPA